MDAFELCVNQAAMGGGLRYATLAEAMGAAKVVLESAHMEGVSERQTFVTIHEHVPGMSSIMVYESAWPKTPCRHENVRPWAALNEGPKLGSCDACKRPMRRDPESEDWEPYADFGPA